MRTHRYILATIIALVCSACGTGDESALTDAERTAIADTIRRLKAAVVDAFDSQDGEFEFPVSEDLVTVVDGRLIQVPRLGRGELVAACRRLSEQRLSATDSIQEENVYVLGPNAAYIVTRSIYTVRWRDGRTTIRPIVATGIWSRQTDGWRLVHFHESWREAEEQTIPPPRRATRDEAPDSVSRVTFRARDARRTVVGDDRRRAVATHTHPRAETQARVPLTRSETEACLESDTNSLDHRAATRHAPPCALHAQDARRAFLLSK